MVEILSTTHSTSLSLSLSLSLCCRLEYKYSKLMVTAGERECELPAADSCAIMEGEDAEDDLIYLTKKSFFGKIKSFSREVHILMHRCPLSQPASVICVFL